MGVGAILCDKKLPNSFIEGGTGNQSLLAEHPSEMPERLEAGTPNVIGIAGLRKGLDFLNSYDEWELQEYEKSLILHFYHYFKNDDRVLFYVDYDKLQQFSPVLSFNIKNRFSEEVAEDLEANGILVRAGLHCAPLAHLKIGTSNSGTVRISPSVFTTMEEINYAICTVKKLL